MPDARRVQDRHVNALAVEAGPHGADAAVLLRTGQRQRRILIGSRPHAHHDRVFTVEQAQHEILGRDDQVRLRIDPRVEHHVGPEEVGDYGKTHAGLDADRGGIRDRLALEERLTTGEAVHDSRFPATPRGPHPLGGRAGGDLHGNFVFVVVADRDRVGDGRRLPAGREGNEPATVLPFGNRRLRADQRTRGAAREDDGEPLVLDHHVARQPLRRGTGGDLLPAFLLAEVHVAAAGNALCVPQDHARDGILVCGLTTAHNQQAEDDR